MTEYSLGNVGKLDAYDPKKHPETAGLVEARLKIFDPREAAYRRTLLGILPHANNEWLFINANQLPVEVNPLGEPMAYVRPSYHDRARGSFLRTNGFYVVTDRDENVFISGKPDPKDAVVQSPIGLALVGRGFTYGHGPVLFSSSDGEAVQMALLNAVIPGLAADIYPNDQDAPDYKLYVDMRHYGGEVIASIEPPSDNSTVLNFPQI